MKKLPILLIALVGFISGCVAYPVVERDNRDYRSGHHQRDRDRDGIPNRQDRDRDGDGVNNRRDAYPNDPRR